MTDRNQTYQNERVSTHSDVQCGSASQKTPFQDRAMPGCQDSFSGHIANKFEKPTILQVNVKSLTASKMNVLHHLAMQSEALVILLQEIHCTDAEKLVLLNYQLAGSSLSRKIIFFKGQVIEPMSQINQSSKKSIMLMGK